MKPLLQMDAGELQKFIYNRVVKNPKFRTVIYVSIDKYPEEVFATVWVGQEPDAEMRQYGSQLEEELAGLGTPCSILIKNERELLFGNTYKLRTSRGEFSYRNYRVDAMGDEDWVFVFALYRGTETYRFRVSLTRTLASLLRGRNLLDDNRILEEYVKEIKRRLEHKDVKADELNEIMFSSRDLARFSRS